MMMIHKEKRKGAQKGGREKNNYMCIYIYIYTHTQIHILYCFNAKTITSIAPSPRVSRASTMHSCIT